MVEIPQQTISGDLTQVEVQTEASSKAPVIHYISAAEAASIDHELMASEGCGFLLPQLMELAGLACVETVFKCYPPHRYPILLVAAGPGNQGGDGLVAARHAKLWGYQVHVWYPKQGKADIFASLRKQLVAMNIDFVDESDFDDALVAADVVLDTIFGFSFQGPPRPPFAEALRSIRDESRIEFEGRRTRPPIVSVDVPSGWSIDGEPNEAGKSTSVPDEKIVFTPDVLLSLTAPKKGVRSFAGRHYLGGRFLPDSIASKYGLEEMVGAYVDNELVVDITNWEQASATPPPESSEEMAA